MVLYFLSVFILFYKQNRYLNDIGLGYIEGSAWCWGPAWAARSYFVYKLYHRYGIPFLIIFLNKASCLL